MKWIHHLCLRDSFTNHKTAVMLKKMLWIVFSFSCQSFLYRFLEIVDFPFQNATLNMRQQLQIFTVPLSATDMWQPGALQILHHSPLLSCFCQPEYKCDWSCRFKWIQECISTILDAPPLQALSRQINFRCNMQGDTKYNNKMNLLWEKWRGTQNTS